MPLTPTAKQAKSSLLNDELDFERLAYPLRKIHDVPKLHYCGHYLNPDDKSKVIPDGASCCWWHWVGLPVRFGHGY